MERNLPSCVPQYRYIPPPYASGQERMKYFKYALVAVASVLWLLGLAGQLPDVMQTAKYIGFLMLMVAVVDDVNTARKRQGRSKVLLHQHDRLPGSREIAASLHQIAHDDWRETLEGFVEQDNFGIANERARDRQHLLLTARQIGAAAAAPLPKAREHFIDAVERPFLRRRQPGKDEIFLDVEEN